MCSREAKMSTKKAHALAGRCASRPRGSWPSKCCTVLIPRRWGSYGIKRSKIFDARPCPPVFPELPKAFSSGAPRSPAHRGAASPCHALPCLAFWQVSRGSNADRRARGPRLGDGHPIRQQRLRSARLHRAAGEPQGRTSERTSASPTLSARRRRGRRTCPERAPGRHQHVRGHLKPPRSRSRPGRGRSGVIDARPV